MDRMKVEAAIAEKCKEILEIIKEHDELTDNVLSLCMCTESHQDYISFFMLDSETRGENGEFTKDSRHVLDYTEFIEKES